MSNLIDLEENSSLSFESSQAVKSGLYLILSILDSETNIDRWRVYGS